MNVATHAATADTASTTATAVTAGRGQNGANEKERTHAQPLEQRIDEQDGTQQTIT